MTNQCGGCRAGIPVEANGFHKMAEHYGYTELMYCQAKKYEEHTVPAGANVCICSDCYEDDCD